MIGSKRLRKAVSHSVFWALNACILAVVLAIGCDGSSGASSSADAGDTDSQTDGLDTEAAGPSTCLECHLDEDALIASLEADPLPEEDKEEEESTGEG
jgi:hypothetical protein